MKKTLMFIAATALAVGVGVSAAAPANALNMHACNSGTFNAFHVHNAGGQGLYNLGVWCHANM